MQRKNFRITSNAGHDVVKHAYNSSLREIECLVRELARKESTVYSLTGSNGVKEGFNYVSGYREWTSREGKAVMFNIELVKDSAP
jgi:hypothetical protein